MQVARRLGPEAFGIERGVRPAMEVVGGEARPVLRPPELVSVGVAKAIEADASGRVRAEIPLAREHENLPDEGFRLYLQRLPQAVPEKVVDRIQQLGFEHEITGAWRLRRTASHFVVEHAPADPQPGERFTLSLWAQQAMALDAEARFQAAPGSVLRLAWGRPVSPSPGVPTTAEFRASLRCGDGVAVEVVRERSQGTDQWQTADLPLGEGGRCAVSLVAEGEDGGPVIGALWAQPRLLVPAPAPSQAPNLVLISLDTLRADHLSGYGYPRSTSPIIDSRLVEQGTTFVDVTTAFSRTDVSHMSLFTGLYPAAQPEPGRLARGTKLPLLAERLGDQGFETAAFTEHGLLSGAFGFWFGFDRFVERATQADTTAQATFSDAVDWLRSNANRRFFLFVHTYKTHSPYAHRPAYDGLFREATDWEEPVWARVDPELRDTVDAYDRTIREADDLVGSLLDTLDELELADDTLVVLTSDHGEAFGERGRSGHSYGSHQEVVRVPLVLRGPSVPAGLRIDVPVSLVDIAPTVAEWASIVRLPHEQGVSLWPAMRGEPFDAGRPLYFSFLIPRRARFGRGVRIREWKYHANPLRRRLYDLSSDPQEREEATAERRRFANALARHERRSAKIREGIETVETTPAPAGLDEEARRQLEALGYLE